MKKVIPFVLSVVLCILCLSGCTTNKNLDKTLLEFPGVKWNATPEEVIKALNLTEDQIRGDRTEEAETDEEMSSDRYIMAVQNITVFNAEILNAQFVFLRYGENEFGLAGIDIYYPEDTDMQTVVDKMVACYGEGNSEPTAFYIIKDGEIVEQPSSSGTMGINGEVWAPEKDPNYIRSYWSSTKRGSEVLASEEQSKMVDYFVGLEHMQMTRETALQFLDIQPMVKVSVVNRNPHAAGKPIEGITHNYLHFNATWLVLMLQCFGK